MSKYFRLERLVKTLADDGRNEIVDILYHSDRPLFISEIRQRQVAKKLSAANTNIHLRKLGKPGVELVTKLKMADPHHIIRDAYELTERGRKFYEATGRAYEEFYSHLGLSYFE